MKRVLVIGIGSLVMRDDGIGSRVVEAIADSLWKHDISSYVGETDFQCCFDEIRPDDLVIIIDAMDQGKEPGSVDVMLLSDALKGRGKLRTQHEFSLFDLIELHAPRTPGYFIGIEAFEIGFGFDLSVPMKKRFKQICANIESTIINIKEREDAGSSNSLKT